MYKTNETRFSKDTGIKFAHITGWSTESRSNVSFWQHIDTNDGNLAQVGPQYKTKMELLSDHEAYLIRAGWKTT